MNGIREPAAKGKEVRFEVVRELDGSWESAIWWGALRNVISGCNMCLEAWHSLLIPHSLSLPPLFLLLQGFTERAVWAIDYSRVTVR